MICKYAVASDIGLRRSLNEDTYGIDDDLNLFVIADGMGGHAAGEIASEMAVKQVLGFIRESLLDEAMTWPFGLDMKLTTDANRILSAIRLANQTIFSAASNRKDLRGMGTTLVMAFFRPAGVYIAHVGDSRAYLLRNGKITQITRDHSLIEDQKFRKIIPPDHSGSFAFKNVITRALGIMEEVEADIQKLPIETGDRFLLCTDGLTDMLSQEEITSVLQNSQSTLDTLCKEFVDRANAHGGKDNITAILIDCL